MLSVALYAIGTTVAQQGHFAPDPKLPWAVKMCELAYREGDIVGYPNTFYRIGARTASRYEYAVVLHAAVTNRLQRLETFLSKPGNDIERASLLRAEALLLYRRADKEFAKELKDLGVQGDYGLDRIAPFAQKIAATSDSRHFRFRDVPFDHWAAKAVGDLRAIGLIHGYPNGKYLRGGRRLKPGGV